MEISLIIQRLKIYFKVKSQKELAERLGVLESNLSNWKSRNTFDYELLFTKCESLNFNWLIYGKGDVYNDQLGNKDLSVLNELKTDYGSLKEILVAKDETIETQRKYIKHLETELEKSKNEKPAESGQKRKVG